MRFFLSGRSVEGSGACVYLEIPTDSISSSSSIPSFSFKMARISSLYFNSSTSLKLTASSGNFNSNPSAIRFNSSSVTPLLSEIADNNRVQIPFASVKICSRFSGLIFSLVKGSTALLYFPWRIICISASSLSSVPLKNITSADRPRKSNIPSGFI